MKQVPSRPGALGFTMIELLVTVSLIGFLLAILLPGLTRARAQAKTTFCQSNLRQLSLANDLYAQDSGGMYCPGAADPLSNLNRWHGRRGKSNEPFRAEDGPLVDHLGVDGTIRACPAFVPEAVGFEAGNGGYGYNNAYVGVQTAKIGPDVAKITTDRAGVYTARITYPGETVMFTDSAFAENQLIEYSFAEPRFHPEYNTRADPSIHFRHLAHAIVAWCDGHVSTKRRTYVWSSGLYRGDPDRLQIGWFGDADDNSLFDLD